MDTNTTDRIVFLDMDTNTWVFLIQKVHKEKFTSDNFNQKRFAWHVMLWCIGFSWDDIAESPGRVGQWSQRRGKTSDNSLLVLSPCSSTCIDQQGASHKKHTSIVNEHQQLGNNEILQSICIRFYSETGEGGMARSTSMVIVSVYWAGVTGWVTYWISFYPKDYQCVLFFSLLRCVLEVLSHK